MENKIKRTQYMQLVMNHTYSQVPLIAIGQGTIEGAWEKAIAKQLQKDYEQGSLLPSYTLSLFGLWNAGKEPTPEVWLKAAYAIRDTELPVDEK